LNVYIVQALLVFRGNRNDSRGVNDYKLLVNFVSKEGNQAFQIPHISPDDLYARIKTGNRMVCRQGKPPHLGSLLAQLSNNNIS